MDEENKAVEEAVETSETIEADDNSVQDSQTEEQTTGEETSQASEETETEGEPRRNAQTRIKQLSNKARVAEERARSLQEQLEELTRPSGFNPQQEGNMPQDSYYNENGEIDPVKYQEHIIQQAEARAELKIRQSEAVSRINREAEEVIREYPELDPKSDSFDKELSESITEAADAYVRSNPYSASVKTFVAKLMKPYKGAIEKQVGQASENIAKQVSRAALRPTNVRKQEKTAKEKSIAELEAELGMVNS